MIIYRKQQFVNPKKVLKAFDYSGFFSALSEIEDLRNRYYLVGYIRYEAKNLFFNKEYKSEYPLLYFEVFEKFSVYEPLHKDVYFLKPVPDISYEEYSNALNKVKNEIKDGNTYEVNYTYDWNIEFNGSELALYDYLVLNQETPYNAYFKNSYDTILSFSPELFFKIQNRHIITKPMKGTVARGKDYVEDCSNIDFLKNDIKNRSENVMIVDLMRNDLGRIAKTGSVKADRLFEIETHKTLHQMTSEIEANLSEDVTFSDVIKALFPCGSITGAPKISTMQIIDEVEKGSRDVYCGAIAYLSPEEIEVSVPIRILQRKSGAENFKYRVGGAIVWDSDIRDEWEETVTKTKMLSPQFSLIETIKVTNKKMFLGEEHIKRLKHSAKVLGFKFNKELEHLQPEKDGILRIELFCNGDYKLEYKTYERTSVNNVRFSNKCISSSNNLLGHKTSYRPFYASAAEKIAAGEVYDEIFLNESGEITEGSRSNILVEKDGKFYTPPESVGLLNGVLRQSLLEAGVCEEKILYKNDLLGADAVFCINSVRGIKRVYIDDIDR